MNCNETLHCLDGFLDAALTAEQRQSFLAHVASCADCQQQLQLAQELRQSLRDLPVPPPRDGFYDEVLARASTEKRRFGYWHRAVGGAIAAGLGLVFALNLWLMPPDGLPGGQPVDIPTVQIALQQTHDIKLVFHADHALANARLTLLLPEDIELAGYDGQRELSWNTQLKQGENLLVLPVTARRVGTGILTAELEHQGRKEVFTVRMDSSPMQQSSNSDRILITV